jgi:hypothetical protein
LGGPNNILETSTNIPMKQANKRIYEKEHIGSFNAKRIQLWMEYREQATTMTKPNHHPIQGKADHKPIDLHRQIGAKQNDRRS